MDSFWPRMIGIYGNAWTAKYGTVPDITTTEAWLTALRQIADYRAEPQHPLIRVGIKACNLMNRTFPPSPGEFLAIVEENRERPEHRRLPHSSRIGVIAAEDHVRDQHLSSIKALLGIEV